MRDQVNEAMNRRGFLGRSALGAGLALAGISVARGASSKPNPFALDLSEHMKTDPALLKHVEVERFDCPGKGTRKVVFGRDGAIYLAASGEVTVVTTGGAVSRRIPVNGEVRCVGVDADGTIYAGLKDHVEVFGPDGAKRATWSSRGERAWLSGIAISGEHVFVADSGNRVVLRFDKSGKPTGTLGKKDTERGVPGLSIPSPYLDVRLGTDGLLRVNNFGRHRVEIYTADGDLEQSWGRPSAAIQGFCGCCNPVSVALLPGGNYVTCEKGLPRVKIYSPEGEFLSVVAGVESFPENAKASSFSKGLDCNLGGLDVAVNTEGTVFVLDIVANDIRVYRSKA